MGVTLSQFETPKQPTKQRPPSSGATTTPSAAVPPRLGPDPLLQEVPVPQLAPVRDLGRELGLARVEAQQRGHAVDHVGEAQPGCHEVGRVVLDLDKAHAAPLGRAHLFRLDEAPQQGRDVLAGRAVARRPQRQQGLAGRGRELEVGVELVLVSDAVGGGGRDRG